MSTHLGTGTTMSTPGSPFVGAERFLAGNIAGDRATDCSGLGLGVATARIVEAELFSARNMAGDSALDCDGLPLDQGTWARAYRQARGARRDALDLLCTLGIITEREFADDLTIIGDAYIEECTNIATEMIKRWPSEHGPPPQHEAKSFFKGRLAHRDMSPRALNGAFRC